MLLLGGVGILEAEVVAFRRICAYYLFMAWRPEQKSDSNPAYTSIQSAIINRSLTTMQTAQSAVQFFQAPQQDDSYAGEYLVTITEDGCTILTELDSLFLDMSEAK